MSNPRQPSRSRSSSSSRTSASHPRNVARRREIRTIKQIKSKRAQKWQQYKLPIIAVLFLCVLGFFVLQIHRVQRFGGDAYAATALAQVVNFHSNNRVINPNRGSITDRNMQPLAVSSIVYNVFVDVRMLAGRPDPPAGSDRISERESNRLALTQFFGMTDAEFDAMLAIDPATGTLINNTMFFVIQREVSHAFMMEYQAWLAAQTTGPNAIEGFRIRDIHFESDSLRTYIHNQVAAPVIGFQRGEWWGLERRFDNMLTGTAGRALTTLDMSGNVVTDIMPPIHGAHIITTLDLSIQRFIEEVVVRWAQDFSATNGAIIVMNPFTGEIVGMAQYPAFNANAPADTTYLVCNHTLTALNSGEFDVGDADFFEQMFRVWTNFNVTVPSEPGSIYKPFTVAKALEEGVIFPGQTFYCEGFMYVAGHRIHCWNTLGHGRLTLTEALAVSCNVAHMQIADTLGRHAFWDYRRDFGFGILTGVDLPGEVAGQVHPIEEFQASELATASFGQRFTVTPIQSITSFAALINGGYMMRPHVVSRVIGDDNSIIMSNPVTVERQVISRETSDWLRRAMEYTVTIGTGGGAAIEGFAQGGKTGTGEQGLQYIDGVPNPNFYWSLSYVGYFPVEDPQYVVLVLLYGVPVEVYEARVGNRSVTPMYREVAQEIIRLRGIAPTVTPEYFGIIHEPEFIENFVGLTVPQAVARLNALGLDYQFLGNAGNVVSHQFPAAGSRATGGPTITLGITDDGTTPLHVVPNVIGHPVDFAQELLLMAGFLPRIVYDSHVGYDQMRDGITATVIGQMGYDVRLPMGTEIVLHARFDED